jgi:hypothetical protein
MSEDGHRMPRWVKISGIVAIALVVLAVGVMALGGHDPGQRGNHSGGGQQAADAGTCKAEAIDHDGGTGGTLTCNDAQGAGQTAHTFTCRNPGFVGLQVDRDLEAGQFTVTVKDGAGSTVFSKTYSGNGDDSANMDGEDGPWEIKAVRKDGFAGEFNVQIYCGSH